jgi:phosphatidylethanolamine-binding protein (PEBP) family uncharacterized protein
MVAATGQKEQESQVIQESQEIQEIDSQYSTIENQILEIFSSYDLTNLSDDDIASIHDAFREQGIKGGPELDSIIESLGYDPGLLNNHLPNLSPDDKLKDPNGPENMGEKKTVKIYEALSTDYGPSSFTLSSSAVENGEILQEFQCEKKINCKEKSIPLNWENVPEGTKSLAIVMYHFPHVGDETSANSYLLLWGIDPSVTEIPYGGATSDEWYMGSNKDGDAISYTSPCSAGAGTHEYHIVIFALSEYPEALPKESTIDVDYSTFMDAIDVDNIIGKAELSFTATSKGVRF